NKFINDGIIEMVTMGPGIQDLWTITTVSGQRSYPLPPGFMSAKLVLYNGAEVEHRPLVTQDFFSSGSGWVTQYALWRGKKEILLGPNPPSDAETLTVYYYREPTYLTDDDDQPEVPNFLRPALARYAAAQVLSADGNVPEADRFRGDFEGARRRYIDWLQYESKGNFRQVRDTAGYI
ncbi:MAG TPA: hypothetical protein VEI97_12090, partial [bacterium]|nr:hypothetical protein [bacterium]